MSRTRSRAHVGARLKKARERRGISLRQVADSTKISVFVLQALERDDISNLPGGVVGRGFVRSFAAAVHLDPEAIVAEFVAQFPSSSVNEGYPAAARGEGDERPDARPVESSFKVRDWEMPRAVRLAAIALVPAALLAVLAYLTGPWTPWSDTYKQVMTAAAGLTDNGIRAAGSDTSTVRVQRSVELPAPSPAVPEPPPASEAMPVPAAVIPAPAPTVSEPVPAAAAVNPPSGVVEEPIRVVLAASAPSWVIASVDGKKTINRLVEAGQQETLEARREVALTAGNGGAIVMTVDGASGKPLGASGQTVTVRINRANLRNYLPKVKSGE